MSCGYSRQRLAEFSLEQIALGFINALKRLALSDAKAALPQYSNADQEYPDDPVRIRMDSAGYATRRERTSGNVMYALKTIPILLINDNYLAGVDFYEQYRNWPLYNGVFDDRNAPHGLQSASEPARNTSLGSKRILSVRQAKDSSDILRIPGANDDEYKINIYLLGREIAETDFFSVILEFLFVLGLKDAAAEIKSPFIANRYLPAWIFARDSLASSTPFQIFQLLGILEAIARYCVLQDSYRELSFDFFAGGQFVAGGCVTRPDRQRLWCDGLRGDWQQGIPSNLTALVNY